VQILLSVGFTFLYGLLEPVAFAIHLKDVTMMSQPVQQGSGHLLPLKDLHPFAERKVAGNKQAASLIAISEDLEQKLGSCSAEGKITKFITDQKLGSVQLVQKSFQLILLVKLLQAINQSGGGKKAYPSSLTAGR